MKGIACGRLTPRARADQSPGGKAGEVVPHVRGDYRGHLEVKPVTDASDAGERGEQQKD